MRKTFGFLKQNPVEAVRRILNVDMPPHQRMAIRQAWEKPYNLWVWGRGCGKCTCGDTIVFTDNGMLQIGNELGVTSQEQMLVPLKRKLWGFSEEAESSHWYCDGHGPTKKITTSIGIELEGTLEHPVLVMCEDGYMRMRRLENIKPGDYVVVEHGQNYFGSSTKLLSVAATGKRVKLPSHMTPALAYWIGLTLGDGCFTESSNTIAFTGLESTQSTWRSLTKEVFDIEPRLSEQRGDTTTYAISRQQLNNWLEQSVGMGRSLSINKSVPISIRKAPKECVAAFLRGLFDTDGGVEHGGAQLYTSSKELARQVQIILLNFGIVSSIQSQETDCNEAYRVVVLSGFNEVFEQEIGFDHPEKKAKLREHNLKGESNGRNHNLFCVPHLGEIVKRLRAKTRETMDCGFSREDNYFIKSFYRKGENQSYDRIAKLPDILHVDCPERRYLQSLLAQRYFFAEVTSVEDSEAVTYDFVVPEGQMFSGNGLVNHNTYCLALISCITAILRPRTRVVMVGSSFRQSKFVMEEVGNIYDQAPYFRECCEKKIIHNPDAVTLNFKNGSSIRAMPLGDGGKIRGARAHLLVIDEAAQVPPDIIDKVVMPMMSTAVDPMLSVKIQRMIDQGKEVPQELMDQLRSNQFVMASSAYYQFNHLYDKFETFSELTAETIEGEENPKYDPKYALHVYDYRDLPKGFMDQGIIEHARVSMPYYDFLMEWQAVFPPDSEGFYKMSMLEQVSTPSVKIKFRGDKNKVYVMGVDPARVSDNFAIVIIELGEEEHSVVRVIHLNDESFQTMRDKILECMIHYPNIQRIAMDTGGGGLALMDMLAGEDGNDLVWTDKTGKAHTIEPIREIDDDSNKRGQRILDMVNFTPQNNHEMATKLRAAFQTGALKLPGYQAQLNPSEEEAALEIQEMKQELANIIAKPTRSGWPKYETIDANKQLKDRASALWLSNKAAGDLTNTDVEEKKELAGGIAGSNVFAVNMGV
jgi:ribonucleoside-diphosphate reductase alpha chain